MSLKLGRLRKAGRKETKGPVKVETDGDSLVVDCLGCRYLPMPSSNECINCMVKAMCENGGTDRIVLRTGMDTEVSGRSCRALRETASLMRWSTPLSKGPLKCRKCEMSRASIAGRIWDAFPSDRIAEERDGLSVPKNEDCRQCVNATRHTLEELSIGMERVRRTMNGGGIR